ncbi:hypothetical protein E2C01_037218 [Portunus trituberculatus]|uniref:Uncharacterized protein n=1 Tax=Portunus trituberculatus TaxID=210409 RepID=A0A5B7FF03_PORTR|nr:hypothetical protein [Portunus trituberculatus]
MHVNGTLIPMKLDMEADVSLVSEEVPGTGASSRTYKPHSRFTAGQHERSITCDWLRARPKRA